MSKSVASFGVNQIIKTEKNAAQKIEEARQRRILRLKQAEHEAKEEVKKISEEREIQFVAFKDRANSINKDAELRVEKAAKAAITDLEQKANKNRSQVIEDMLRLVCDVKPRIHQNYIISKSQTRKFTRPEDAFKYNIRSSYSDVKSSSNATDQYEIIEGEEVDEIKHKRYLESSLVTDLCNICNPDTRIKDGRVCLACNPNATFGDPKELDEWKCPGILCDGGGLDISSERPESTAIVRAETVYHKSPFTDIRSLISEEKEYSISVETNTTEIKESDNLMQWENDGHTEEIENLLIRKAEGYTNENGNYNSYIRTSEYLQSSHGVIKSNNISTREYHKSSHAQVKLNNASSKEYYELNHHEVRSNNISNTEYHESSHAQVKSKTISSTEYHELNHHQLRSNNISTKEYQETNKDQVNSNNIVTSTKEYHESSHGDKHNIESVQELQKEKQLKDDSLMGNRNRLLTTLDLSENPSEKTTIIIEIPRIGDNFHPSLPWEQTHCRKCSKNTRNITINLNSMETYESNEPNSTKESKIIEEPSQTEDERSTAISSEWNVPRSGDITSQIATISTTTFNVSTNEDNDSLCEPEF